MEVYFIRFQSGEYYTESIHIIIIYIFNEYIYIQAYILYTR